MKNENPESGVAQMRQKLMSQITDARKTLDAMSKEVQDLQVISPDFNCSKLLNYTEDSIRETSLFGGISKSKPTIYWFEIVGEGGNSSIINALCGCIKKKIKVPYLNEREARKNDTSILYLGKVKKGFDTRLMQHLGIKISKTTQGLRFREWAENIQQEIKLHYIQFEPDEKGMVADLMSFFEYRLALENNPIAGKHL